MFSKLLALAVSASALVGAIPSFQAPMVSCSLTESASVAPALEAGYYQVYNGAMGVSRLASFNPASPVLVLPGEVPEAYVTWKVTPVPGTKSEYHVMNVGTGSGASLDDDVIITAKGFGDSVTIEPLNDGGYRIHAHVQNDNRVWVWHTCEPDMGLARVHTDPIFGVPQQTWYFKPTSFRQTQNKSLSCKYMRRPEAWEIQIANLNTGPGRASSTKLSARIIVTRNQQSSGSASPANTFSSMFIVAYRTGWFNFFGEYRRVTCVVQLTRPLFKLQVLSVLENGRMDDRRKMRSGRQLCLTITFASPPVAALI
ncbi:hypothetical protein C8R45DRAFT_928229 [Mycena sanguinolenta]|nr:hypothetical protein C8R45DRAFT_928229 [Mycena sanguinolenta]